MYEHFIGLDHLTNHITQSKQLLLTTQSGTIARQHSDHDLGVAHAAAGEGVVGDGADGG